jgi:hypothetical protein
MYLDVEESSKNKDKEEEGAIYSGSVSIEPTSDMA